jgi:ribosomal protein S18 acetylase RimI-like enzyme
MNIEPYFDELDDELWALLLLADPDKERVKSYLAESQVFVAVSAQRKVGIAVLSIKAGEFELKNIAVHPSKQGKGIAKSLIALVKHQAKKLGAQCLFVGTGNSSLDQIGLYQKCGFRIFGVKSNFFSSYEPPIYENGIRCMDMLILKAEL